jgi:hypothetical protein
MKIILSLLVLVLLGGGAFYWVELRPSKIKAECNKWAMSEEKKESNSALDMALRGELTLISKDYETLYNQCLREKGI